MNRCFEVLIHKIIDKNQTGLAELTRENMQHHTTDITSPARNILYGHRPKTKLDRWRYFSFTRWTFICIEVVSMRNYPTALTSTQEQKTRCHLSVMQSLKSNLNAQIHELHAWPKAFSTKTT